jgi:hypothetical protein
MRLFPVPVRAATPFKSRGEISIRGRVVTPQVPLYTYSV